MDEITKSLLMRIAEQHPQSSVRLASQFLDGTEKKPCGFVPNNWNGSIVSVGFK